MRFESSKQDKRQFLTLRKIKWAGIILPIGFLVTLDLLRHTYFYGQLHILRGFIATYAIIAFVVVIFSFTIFGFIDRLQRKIIEQNRHLAALNNIAEAAAVNTHLEELLSVSLGEILSSMNVESGLICLVDMEKEEHSVVCYRGLSPEFVRKIQRTKIKDHPIANEVVRTGKPVIIERCPDDPRVMEAAKQAGIKFIVSAPLKSEDEVNGILAIMTHEERRFSDDDRHFLHSVGGQLGLAIRKAKLYQQSELQNRELGALLAVGKAVTGSFDLMELLAKSLDTTIEVMRVDAAEIWLMEGKEELTIRCQRGSYREAFSGQTRFRIGEGMPGLVAHSHEPILVHDLPNDSRFLRKEAIRAGFHTLCALPLLFQGELVGVLLVAALSADAIREQREFRLLEGIGEWLAIAIENARLYQQVQDVAVLQERERIAREMHDGMAQLLGYINTQTLAVKKLLSDNQTAKALEALKQMEEIARDLYADVREGILGLRTKAMRDDGLLPSLRLYAERYMEMTNIKVQFNTVDDVESLRLPASVEIQLMRIVQEALTNVRKHAKATEVSVALEQNDSKLQVAIADNGQGFELTRLPSTGWPRFGLQTMRERAEAVGGSLNIYASIGHGTRVEVQVPVLPQEG